MRKGKLSIISLALLTSLLSGCDEASIKPMADKRLNILCFVSGDATEARTGKSFYDEIVKLADDPSINADITINSLFYIDEYYAPTIESLMEGDYDVFIFGDEKVSKEGENALSLFPNKKVITINSNYDTKRDNVFEINYNQEQLGYVAGYLSALQSSKNAVGFIYDVKDEVSRATQYGFIQGAKACKNNNEVVSLFIEEDQANYYKSFAYAEHVYKYSDVLFTDSIIDINGFLDSSNEGVNRKIIGANKDFFNISLDVNEEEYSSTIKASVLRNDSVGIKEALLKLDNAKFNCDHAFDFKNGGLSLLTNNLDADNKNAIDKVIDDIKNDNVTITPYKDNVSQFKELLASSKIENEEEIFTCKNSVYCNFNEAIADTNAGWKYSPRYESRRPIGWECIGQWCTFYKQDNCDYVDNVAIEYRNMTLFGYSPSKAASDPNHDGWVLLARGVDDYYDVKGSFYEKSFVDDYNTFFTGKAVRKTDSDGIPYVRLILDKDTEGFLFHPFTSQINLKDAGCDDIEYVISYVDARLVKEDVDGPDNLDQARYVFDSGGDWWHAQGETWNENWTSNKEVAIGAYRTIEREWKRAYMCTVPEYLYDEIVPDYLFEVQGGSN